MTDATADTATTESEPGAKSRKPVYALWIAVLLAGVAGGFLATRAGFIPLPGTAPLPAGTHGANQAPATGADIAADTTFVAIDPIMVSLGDGKGSDHLRFRAELEVGSADAAEVTAILPRIVDVLNGYLRAIETEDLRNPQALTRLRGQMLRRIAVVAGPDRVRDLLIMEFVLN